VLNTRPVLDISGRLLLFESQANDLVDGDRNLAPDVFLVHLERGQLELISRADPSLVQSSGTRDIKAFRPQAVSADGRRVALESTEPFLAEGDSNGEQQDIFVADSNRGVQLVSGLPDGIPGAADYAFSPSLSADGQYVTFVQRPVGIPGQRVLWRNLAGTNAIVVFSTGTDPLPGEFSQVLRLRTPAISSDGRYVAFFKSDMYHEFYIADMFDAVPTIRTLMVDGQGWSIVIGLAFSPDGRWLLYVKSSASTLSELGIYAVDLLKGGIHRVSYGPGFAPTAALPLSPDAPGSFVRFTADSRFAFYVDGSNGAVMRHELTASNANTLVCTACRKPSPSADGRLVAVEMASPSYVPHGIVLINMETGQTNLVSVNATGTGDGNGPSRNPMLSYDGRFVVFGSQASDLVTGDNNGFSDIFVRDLPRNTTLLVSLNQHGTAPGNAPSQFPILAADGRSVFFMSFASDLVENDSSRNRDLFQLQLRGPDSDQDGLPDDWELAYFDTLDRDGHGDFDGDGQSDEQEYRAGTDPTNRGSVFQVFALEQLPGGSRKLLWNSAPGRRYLPEYRDGVDAKSWTYLGPIVLAAGTTCTSIDARLLSSSTRFYRVRLVD
jgi:Tol biopolymer transport system component